MNLDVPLTRAAGTPVLNLRFQKDTLADREGLAGVASLIRSFFERGGRQPRSR